MTVKRYRKKPVEIDAVQYTGHNSDEIRDLVGEDLIYSSAGMIGTTGAKELHIRTLEGDMHVSQNDWVIKGVKGEFYPVKPDIFEASYDEVEGQER